MTTISVALCTYNGADYLRDQLESLAAQTQLPSELHVGDDRSTDDTIRILEEFRQRAPFPVHIEVNQQGLGYGENFIRTALRCSAPWVAFCDQDDVWLPNKLERCSELIANGPDDLQLVAHDVLVIDEHGERLGPLSGWPDYTEYGRLSLWPGWFCFGLCQVFRRQLLTDIPSLQRQMDWVDVEDAHDVWVPLIAAAIGTVISIGEPLALYRRHSDNVSPLPWEGAGSPFDAEAYRRGALRVEATSRTLGEVATRVRDPKLATMIADASMQYGKLADRLLNRVELYGTGGVAERLKRLRALVASGAYQSNGCFTFGRRALIADSIAVLRPHRGAPFATSS